MRGRLVRVAVVVLVAGAVVSADGPADVHRAAATPPESPPSLLTVQTGRTLLYAAAFSPDGALVATAGDDVVQLWSTATGEPVGAAIPVGADVGDVAFSPDGALLAASGGDGAVRLWNVADRRREDVKVARAAGALAFSPDGRRLAVVTDSGVGLLDVPTRTTEGFLDGSKSYLLSTAFDPTGRQLAACGIGGGLRLWDVASRREVGEFIPYVEGEPDPTDPSEVPITVSVRSTRASPRPSAAGGTAASASGISRRANRSPTCSVTRRGRFATSRSARTAVCWPPRVARTSSCGAWSTSGRRAGRCRIRAR